MDGRGACRVVSSDRASGVVCWLADAASLVVGGISLVLRLFGVVLLGRPFVDSAPSDLPAPVRGMATSIARSGRSKRSTASIIIFIVIDAARA